MKNFINHIVLTVDNAENRKTNSTLVPIARLAKAIMTYVDELIK